MVNISTTNCASAESEESELRASGCNYGSMRRHICLLTTLLLVIFLPCWTTTTKTDSDISHVQNECTSDPNVEDRDTVNTAELVYERLYQPIFDELESVHFPKLVTKKWDLGKRMTLSACRNGSLAQKWSILLTQDWKHQLAEHHKLVDLCQLWLRIAAIFSPTLKNDPQFFEHLLHLLIPGGGSEPLNQTDTQIRDYENRIEKIEQELKKLMGDEHVEMDLTWHLRLYIVILIGTEVCWAPFNWGICALASVWDTWVFSKHTHPLVAKFCEVLQAQYLFGDPPTYVPPYPSISTSSSGQVTPQQVVDNTNIIHAIQNDGNKVVATLQGLSEHADGTRTELHNTQAVLSAELDRQQQEHDRQIAELLNQREHEKADHALEMQRCAQELHKAHDETGHLRKQCQDFDAYTAGKDGEKTAAIVELQQQLQKMQLALAHLAPHPPQPECSHISTYPPGMGSSGSGDNTSVHMTSPQSERNNTSSRPTYTPNNIPPPQDQSSSSSGIPSGAGGSSGGGGGGNGDGDDYKGKTKDCGFSDLPPFMNTPVTAPHGGKKVPQEGYPKWDGLGGDAAFRHWLGLLNSFAQVNGVTHHQLCNVTNLGKVLIDGALEWFYDCYPDISLTGDGREWPGIIEHLRFDHCTSMHPQNQYKKLMSIKQGASTLREYVCTFRSLLREGKKFLSAEGVKHQFLLGLNQKPRTEILEELQRMKQKGEHPFDLEGMIRYAIGLDFGVRQGKEMFNSQGSSGSHSASSSSAPKMTSYTKSSTPSRGNASANGPTPMDVDNTKPTMVCFNCNGTGHKAVNCPSPANNTTAKNAKGKNKNGGKRNGGTSKPNNNFSSQNDSKSNNKPRQVCAKCARFHKTENCIAKTHLTTGASLTPTAKAVENWKTNGGHFDANGKPIPAGRDGGANGKSGAGRSTNNNRPNGNFRSE